MSELHTKLKSTGRIDITVLNSELEQLLELKFVEVDGAVLLKTQKKMAKRVGIDDFPDRTGYECFVNHVHIDDYCDGELSPEGLLGQGWAFASRIVQELTSSFPGRRFKVIVAFDVSDCSIRFHEIRQGENWLSGDIEQYKEAILVLETESPNTTTRPHHRQGAAGQVI